MRYTASFLSTIALGLFVLAVGIPMAEATHLATNELKCFEGLAKAAGKFVVGKQKTIQKCNDKNLKEPGSCPDMPDLSDAIAKLESKVRADIGKKCAPPLNVFGLGNMGFPGKCSDPNPADNFTLLDLQNCIATTHELTVDDLIDIEYGTTIVGPLPQLLLKCQSEIAKNAGKFVAAKLKTIQKCRNGLNKHKLTGFLPEDCATEPKTALAIAKAETKARDKIASKCTEPDIQALDVCAPVCVPVCATTVLEAQNCIIKTHGDAVDTTDPNAIDLIDIEYAAQPICGDGVRNSLQEECDGSDDADCPGQCGSPTGVFGTPSGSFACLCLDIPRQRIIEHAAADLDNGWTGISHDSGIVEGGGYVVDLYDCDNVTDFDCNVGPSCSGAPHFPCSSDAGCAFFGQGTCRKRQTAVGPHCNTNPQVVCVNDSQCTGPGDFCLKQFHGAPLPLSSGGVSVCVINIFSEDVVGTTNLQTGAGAVRLRQASVTYLGPVADQPCPVCGGFCSGTLGAGGAPGQRQRCTLNSDCASNNCITGNICSYGANADKECRPDPPFGGDTDLFGNPSQDCGPPPGAPISGPAGLDILFNPATTGSVQLIPTHECDNFAFASNRCIDGANEGRPCTSGVDCPGGTCNEQCFCPSGSGRPQQPNACNNACVGGGNDGLLCTNDGQCPSGFCHTADCRVNPLDLGSSEEGACQAGPSAGTCSVTKFKSCALDADCQGINCPFCGVGETCVFAKQQCFVNSGINRTGSPGVPDKDTVAIFCIAATSSAAINNTAGIPGPGAITTPTTSVETGL